MDAYARTNYTLQSIGLDEQHDWTDSLRSNTGLCLVCGPVGSAKFVTARASQLERYLASVKLPGDFGSSVLMPELRDNNDVIEALSKAQSQLVIATVHCETCEHLPARLQQIGLSVDAVAKVLRGVIVQRRIESLGCQKPIKEDETCPNNPETHSNTAIVVAESIKFDNKLDVEAFFDGQSTLTVSGRNPLDQAQERTSEEGHVDA